MSFPGCTSLRRSPVWRDPAALTRSRIRPPDRRPVALDGVDVVDVDDVRRSLADASILRRPGRRLARPGMVLLARRPAPRSPPSTPRPHAAASVTPARVGALTEREHVEPVVARLEGVGVVEREMHDAVARTDR